MLFINCSESYIRMFWPSFVSLFGMNYGFCLFCLPCDIILSHRKEMCMIERLNVVFHCSIIDVDSSREGHVGRD